MKSKYYTPVIEEFVQDFEFQYLLHKKGDRLGGICFFDMNGDSKTTWYDYEEDVWMDMKVFWKREPKVITTNMGGISVTYKELPLWNWAPWVTPGYIEKLIEDGKVRAERNI